MQVALLPKSETQHGPEQSIEVGFSSQMSLKHLSRGALIER
jgi:hypothetical protein